MAIRQIDTLFWNYQKSRPILKPKENPHADQKRRGNFEPIRDGHDGNAGTMSVQPQHRGRHVEPRLVAESDEARPPPQSLDRVESDGRGLRLRQGVPEPRLRDAQEG